MEEESGGVDQRDDVAHWRKEDEEKRERRDDDDDDDDDEKSKRESPKRRVPSRTETTTNFSRGKAEEGKRSVFTEDGVGRERRESRRVFRRLGRRRRGEEDEVFRGRV